MISSLFTVPENTNKSLEKLSLTLWGRAQVLMSLQEYPSALRDIQYAVKLGLPNAIKGDVYWKMAVCYRALNEENKAKVSFGIAETFLGQDQIDNLNKDKKTVFTYGTKDKLIKGIISFLFKLTHIVKKMFKIFLKFSLQKRLA